MEKVRKTVRDFWTAMFLLGLVSILLGSFACCLLSAIAQ